MIYLKRTKGLLLLNSSFFIPHISQTITGKSSLICVTAGKGFKAAGKIPVFQMTYYSIIVHNLDVKYMSANPKSASEQTQNRPD